MSQVGLTEFPLGKRGERPVVFRASLNELQRKKIWNMPGVVQKGDLIYSTWDAAPFVASLIEVDTPLTIPDESNVDMNTFVDSLPGLARYRELGLSDVLYPTQKEDALFAAYRAYSMLVLPPRTGKTLTSLATSLLIDAERTLIVCPALARRVWAREINKWLKETRVVLITGRGANELQVMCQVCGGTRYVDNKPCTECAWRGKPRGFIPRVVNYLTPKPVDGMPDKSRFVCRKHKSEPILADKGSKVRCKHCLTELVDLMRWSKYAIVNYDCLVTQQRVAADGRKEADSLLPGAIPLIGSVRFDLAIGDEIHYIRGWQSGSKRLGSTRRERFNQACDLIPRVIGLTATPIYGFIRDLWGQFDAVSAGAVSGKPDRLPFSFHRYFCDGHKDAYGWVANGRTTEADTELPQRMKTFVRIRTRDEIAMQLPVKRRQIIQIEPDKPVVYQFRKGDNAESKFSRMVSAALSQKIDAVVENVMTELAAGQKSIVFTYARESAKQIYDAIKKVANEKDSVTRMRQVELATWLCRGGDMDGDARAVMAESFVRHQGAAVVVATIDSLPGMVSLKGATTVHFAELHWNPAVIIQAEDRPYESGAERLSILYYFVLGSIDERFESALLPKIESLDRTMGDKTAANIRETFAGQAEPQSLNDVLDFLCAGMPTNFSDDGDFNDEDYDD